MQVARMADRPVLVIAERVLAALVLEGADVDEAVDPDPLSCAER